MEKIKIDLLTEEMPQCWYNILSDLPEPLPEPKGDLKILSETMIAEPLGQEFSNLAQAYYAKKEGYLRELKS